MGLKNEKVIMNSHQQASKSIYEEKIFEALTTIHIEDLSLPLANNKSITITIQDDTEAQRRDQSSTHGLGVHIKFHYVNKSQHQRLLAQVTDCLTAINVPPIHLSIESQVKRHQVQSNTRGIANIKNIIAIGSGKGGVGKSTIAVNLARALSQEGASVGLLDADIYGPSIPTMLGIHERPTSPDGKTMTPLKSGDINAMSIGFLTQADTPMIWRGPIVTNTLKQLLSETNWGELDYLVIDLPPGTGDTQLTLAQHIPVSGAIIVTTPQNVALADAKKAIRMFEKVNICILGVVENMSHFVCRHCQQLSHIFQAQGGSRLAKDYMVNLLGEIPLDERICQAMDRGTSLQHIHHEQNEPPVFTYYQKIARKVSAVLSQQPIDFTAKLPKVEIRNLN